MARRPTIVTAHDYGRTFIDGRQPFHGVERNGHAECNRPPRGSRAHSGVPRHGVLGKLQDALEITYRAGFVDVIVHADRLPDDMLRRIPNETPPPPRDLARSASGTPPRAVRRQQQPPPSMGAHVGTLANDALFPERNEPGGTVFLPSDLTEYVPNQYPWNTIGRVVADHFNSTGVGSGGTGAFVSSSVVITSNHILSSSMGANFTQAVYCYGADGSIFAPISFRPGASTDLNSPPALPVRGVMRWNHIADPNSISPFEQAFDYAFLSVELPSTKTFSPPGWMQLLNYSKNWNGLPIWNAGGYPNSGKYTPVGFQTGDPVVHQNGTIADSQTKGDNVKGLRLAHGMDFLDGMSGGPIFGWPLGVLAGPRIVGVQATHGSGDVVEPSSSKKWNHASGGGAMLLLFSLALEYFGWAFGTTK
ncbi:MAG: trypsin-like peptidase domain-containing protein [Myxococcales bacterium]|nr:trypsin-like peptidase domain-containing protein [Myxococcales bacterium]